jgi:hypothetical protein
MTCTCVFGEPSTASQMHSFSKLRAWPVRTMEQSGLDSLLLESRHFAAGICQKVQLHINGFVRCQAEWGSDVKSLEKNCGSCVAAVRSSTSMLTR